ncbi:MAG: HigA family addiction module antidote protein [Cytophagaceae bacterium]|nr:HigA family addiction module antidote protein [Cytophagaceae bacterium]
MSRIYANDIVLKDVFHPGEFIKDELEAREMKQQELTEKMGIAKNVLSEIIHGKRNLTPTLALKLESALGISAEFWMKLQVNYDINLIRNQYGVLIDKTKVSGTKKTKLTSAVYKVVHRSKKPSIVKTKRQAYRAAKKKK